MFQCFLQVLLPHFDILTDQQLLDVCNLKQSCQQAEDALTQGMEKLQHTLADCVAAGQLGEGSYIPQVNSAMERLEALVSFVNQVNIFNLLFILIKHISRHYSISFLILFLCSFLRLIT